MLNKLHHHQPMRDALRNANLPTNQGKRCFKPSQISQRNSQKQSVIQSKDKRTTIKRLALLPERRTDFLQSRFRKKDNCVEMNISYNGLLLTKRSKGEFLEEITSLRQSKISKDKKISNSSTTTKKNKQNLLQQEGESRKQASLLNTFLSTDYFKPKKYCQFEEKFNKMQQKYENQKEMELFMQNIIDASLFYRFRDGKRSRYDIQYLHSMHNTIFSYSKGHKKILQKAFLIVLNLSGILVDEEKLQQINFDPLSIQTFQGFMKNFKEIETYYFKQSIQDYLFIIFSSQDEEINIISLNQIRQALQKRMSAEEASTLARQIEEKIKEKYGINIKEIELELMYEVCLSDPDLCRKIHEKYKDELHKGKLQKIARC